MRRALILTSICATAWCTTSPVKAMGFGITHNPSLLGQPLDFAAQVRISADEELSRECVVAEVYAGENRLGSDQVRVQVRPGRDANERAVRVRTVSALNEPVVTINLTVGCTSKMSRQFGAFLDPPMLNVARGRIADRQQQRSAFALGQQFRRHRNERVRRPISRDRTRLRFIRGIVSRRIPSAARQSSRDSRG